VEFAVRPRVAVLAIDAFLKRRPEVLRYYRRTVHPSESFVQTVLANDASLRLSGDTRRYTGWGDRKPTGPRVLASMTWTQSSPPAAISHASSTRR
jgi:hypothetical protein